MINESHLEFGKGQRWGFRTNLAEFEKELIVGNTVQVVTPHGTQIHVEVFVGFTAHARHALPPNIEGLMFALTPETLERNVTKLVEHQVNVLPDAMRYGATYLCDTLLSEKLLAIFKDIKLKYALEKKKRIAMQTTLDELRKKGPRLRSKSVAESWQRLATFLNSVGDEFSLREVAGTDAIERLEILVGSRLPPDFRESLRLQDGNYWWVLPNYGDLLPVAEIQRRWSTYKEEQESGSYANDSEEWQVCDCHGPIKRTFWSVKRIPVTDNSGDHLLIDLDPPNDGVYGQVVYHSHEVGPVCVVAPSWADFLANLVDDLEDGKYFWDDSAEYLKQIQEPEKGGL